MRRPITQIGQSVYEWLFTRPAQDAMVAVSKLAAACFGTGGIVNGLACAPTSPATLTVQVGPGEIYQLSNLESTTCGTLPANTTNQIVKQGIQLNAYTTATLAAPSTAGYSINYLIEVQYQDSDISVDPTTGNSPVELQFYNSSNPQQPYSGPNNTGQTSNTFRDGVVAPQVKTGIAAATGSQQTPSVDPGWIGIAVVTVAYGQSTITSANITALTSGVLPAGLLQAIQGNQLTYAKDTGVANAMVVTLQPAPSALVDGMIFETQIAASNTGPSTLNLNGFGAKPIIGTAHAALQGTELVAGGKGEFMWHAGLASFILLGASGGAQQLGTGSYGVTPPQFDATSKLATMQALQRALGNFQTLASINASSTLTSSQVGSSFQIIGTTVYTTTVPVSTAVGAGASLFFMNTTSVAQAFAVQGSDKFYTPNSSTGVSTASAESGGTLMFVSDGVGGWHLLSGSSVLPYSSLFSASIAQNGYEKSPSGIIRQWGYVSSIASNSSANVTFPIAFPSAAMVVMATPSFTGPGTSAVSTTGVTATPSSTSFTIYNQGSAACGCFWYAIGH